ncbi:MAG: cob(I)yrinic acid a,c-diamide adenosyltransferase [Prevotella sp.]|nr:cob(I)yrinic acid a,c-diamide adenosyltransferase [Prevotella sp.]MBP3839314.1 cob(I)yrinic acid a,c-diamide adenosyltransferase [Prevotella sp.]
MSIPKVYTKTGDKGTTGLVGGVRVKKSSARIEAYGTVDELGAHLGLLASWMKDGHDKRVVENAQSDLFVIGSYLATDQTRTELYDSCKLDPKEVMLLEREIDHVQASIPPRTTFILAGGSHPAALAHVARTVCRRAERRILALGETAVIAPEILEYMNRLSDYLFVLSRKLNFIDGVREKTWQKNSE